MDLSEELARLAELFHQGALSEEEFKLAKAKVIGNATVDHDHTAPSAGLHAWHRSPDDRWIGGVCGGLGEVSGVPSWTWRVLFTLLAVLHGFGIPVYLLLWVFLPLGRRETPKAV